MHNLIKILVLLIGGALVVSGCASSVTSLSEDVTYTTTASPTPKQMTREEIATAKLQGQLGVSNSFVFYNSYASW